MTKMEVRIWCSVINCGDGSAITKFFKTRADAEADLVIQEKISGDYMWAEECIEPRDFVFDENGNFLNPDEIEEDWEDD